MRLAHTLCHYLAHTSHLNHSIALHQFQIGLGSGRSNSRCSCHGVNSSRGILLRLSSGENILQDNAAGGAGTHDTGIIHAQLLGGLAGQRRNPNALTTAGGSGHRGGSCGCRHGRRSSHGSGGRSDITHDLAGLTDVTQQTFDGDVIAFLCHDLDEHAIVLADHFVGQLISGDLQNRVACLDGVTLMLEPCSNSAFFHGQTQLGHNNFKSHFLSSQSLI